jgi:hypothetical protein
MYRNGVLENMKKDREKDGYAFQKFSCLHCVDPSTEVSGDRTDGQPDGKRNRNGRSAHQQGDSPAIKNPAQDVTA